MQVERSGEPLTEAYILIQTEVGKQAQVAQELAQIPGVMRPDVVAGPYDVVARVAAPDMDSLGKLIVGRIQTIDGIIRTLTCTIVHV